MEKTATPTEADEISILCGFGKNLIIRIRINTQGWIINVGLVQVEQSELDK